MKQCNSCQEQKESMFRKRKYSDGKPYLVSICRKCESSKQVKRIKKNGDKRTIQQKKDFVAYKKEWRRLNKNTENKKYRDRITNDVSFRLRKNVSRAINRALKKLCSNKSASIMQYLNYSMDELKKHLENQFDDKMSWTNYGIYWHIDHIVPQSCLSYMTMADDNFRKCWALDNLRPLDAKSNMLEGATRIRHKMYHNFLTERSNG